MFIGGILSALGLLISAFAADFYVILLTFGLLAGVGYGLAYTAAIVVIGEHFFKYRSLAFGISLAGGSVGNIAFPWISTALINHFGWRGFFAILLALWNSVAGLVVCACAFGFISSVAPTTNECIFIITGPELFNFSYGQATVFMGIGWIAGAPAAGLLYDATMYYPNSFYLGGAVTILGALVMVPAAIKEKT